MNFAHRGDDRALSHNVLFLLRQFKRIIALHHSSIGSQ